MAGVCRPLLLLHRTFSTEWEGQGEAVVHLLVPIGAETVAHRLVPISVEMLSTGPETRALPAAMVTGDLVVVTGEALVVVTREALVIVPAAMATGDLVADTVVGTANTAAGTADTVAPAGKGVWT